MEIYAPITGRLPTRKPPLSLLLAALTAAMAATLLSPNLIAPEPRSTSVPIAAAKPIVSAVASGTSTRHANPNQTKSVQKPDQRRALILYILHGLSGHPLGILN
jgi:hypothetical protein